MKTIDYDYLLNQYREIWNNRRFESEKSPETILKEAIVRDLLDENTHPRARRGMMEKYYLSTKRIIESTLNSDDKILLLQLHINQLEMIKSEI